MRRLARASLVRSSVALLLVCGAAGGTGAPARPDAPAAPEASSAPAQAVDPEAARLYEEGQRYFTLGEHDLAIERLKAAYLKAPLPALLYNLAQAFRLKGDSGSGGVRRAGARKLTERLLSDIFRGENGS